MDFEPSDGKRKDGKGHASNQGDCWLTILEVANRWKVSERTVRRELDRGKLGKFLKIGSRVRIPFETVVSYEKKFTNGR